MSFTVCRGFTRIFGRLILPTEASCRCSRQYSTRLCEVGRWEAVQDQENTYHTGQLFLHKVFSYRGVILYPWMAKVFDRDKATKTEVKNPVSDQTTSSREVRAKTHPYYQVLMDSRDSSYVLSNADAVTFLGDFGNQKEMFAVRGLDYVAHEDVVPYTSTETSTPIHHELFDKFLIASPENSSNFVEREAFTEWQKKHHPRLRLSSVYKETTNNIRVTVTPFYMGCRRPEESYWWRYCVRLENFSDQAMQVIDKHLSVFSSSGSLDRLKVRSLIEQIPPLTLDCPAYQYSSLVSLQASSGQIWGTFTMEKSDGTKFDVIIPPFGMEMCPEEKYDPNYNLIW